MEFGRETVEKIEKDLSGLIADHYSEVAAFHDIPLQPNYELYKVIEKQKGLRIFTLRGEKGELMGYAVFFVNLHPHFKKSLQARNDLLYVHPSIRGEASIPLLKYCEDELRSEEVDVIWYTSTAKRDLRALFKRLNYDLAECCYAKRIYREVKS